MAKNMNFNIDSLQVYVSRHEELKKLYKECKIRKNVTKKWKITEGREDRKTST